MNLGEKIAQLRKKNNMTQAELGDVLNVTYQAVSKWERSESLPDFDTISKISKLFQVPISYFDEGGENQFDPATAAAVQQSAEIIGMCVQCGKVVHEGEAAETTPKLICKACAELNLNAEKQRRIDEENKKAAEVKRAQDSIKYEKGKMKKRRNLALLISIIPAAAVFVLFLVLALLPSNSGMFTPVFTFGIILTVIAYTFTAQMIWDGIVREVCTGGGHVMSLPGVIFSLSPDGLLFLIVTKIFLSIVAAFVFVGSIILCVISSLVIAPFTFVPSLLLYNRRISKVGK